MALFPANSIPPDTAIIGAPQYYTVDLSATGIQYKDLSVSIPTIDGATFSHWEYSSGTSRYAPIGFGGNSRFFYYVFQTHTSDVQVTLIPIYKKN